MKKIILIAITLLVISVVNTSAQVAWGVRAGLGYTTSHSSEGVNTKGNMSFEIGPTAYYSLSEKVYLNSGLNLSLKRFGDTNDTNESAGSMNYTSLELPVNIGYRFNVGVTSLYAQAGPFIGVKVGEKINFNESVGGVNGISTDYFNRINYGINAAVGINIKKFKIEVGYQVGLSNILTDKFWKDFYGYGLDEYFDTGDNPKLSLNTLFLGVSYVF